MSICSFDSGYSHVKTRSNDLYIPMDDILENKLYYQRLRSEKYKVMNTVIPKAVSFIIRLAKIKGVTLTKHDIVQYLIDSKIPGIKQ